MDPVSEFVVASIMGALAALLILTLFVGIAVAVRPSVLDRLRVGSDRRVSMRRATRLFDQPRNIDHVFYRYHRTYGSIVVALAIFLLYVLVFGDLRPGLPWTLGGDVTVVTEILVTTARGVLWGFAIFALVIGTIVFVRPSALKGMERWANRWLTPRRLTRGLERAYYPLERGVSAHPRLWGMSVAAVSLVCLVALYYQWRMSGLGA